jgi:predicted  nucleic acid-binding Zn-ribbon protein
MAMHPAGFAEKLERLDTEMRGLTNEIESLEERLRAGDKGAYRTCKYQRVQLSKLRQERSELEKRMKRLGMAIGFQGA